MKSVIQTIVVFVTLALAVQSFAKIVPEPMEAARKGMEVARKHIATAQKEVRQKAEAARRGAEHAAEEAAETIRYYAAALARTPQLGEKVLVVPAGRIKAEDFAAIMEDMNVMSRILDKKLGWERLGGMGGYGGGIGGGGLVAEWPGFFGDHRRATESIYLAGYGTLFLMKVDFPLLPLAELPKEEQIKEDVDPVWQETKREIFMPEDVRRRSRRGRRSRTRSAQEYDAEKVQELKTRLIKALKHAANIRSLKPDEGVVLSVTGGSQAGRGITGVIQQKRITVVTNSHSQIPLIAEIPFSDETRRGGPAILTIRAKKSDVDAFSKGKLDFDQFRKRTRIFIY